MPPLLGDGKGHYKVHITGNSGSGKTTTGVALAALLKVPYVSLDELYWQPGWKEPTTEEFQAKVRKTLDQHDRGWVVDGNYNKRLGNIVLSESTDLIWLDPPLLLYFPRVFYRTMLRWAGLCPPCSPGCDETISKILSKTGILWWCLTNHWPVRRGGRARMAELGLDIGTNIEGRKMRRLGGWGGELNRWLKEVELMCRAREKTA